LSKEIFKKKKRLKKNLKNEPPHLSERLLHPPEPATFDMLMMTFFPSACNRFNECIMMSLATAEPPGLFTRTTTALIDLFLMIVFVTDTNVSQPMLVWPFQLSVDLPT
jgi:hypothetical protein